MYRDMTRGSITRGLLLFALPMAAGARVALAYAPAGPVGVNGIWAAIPIGWFLADAVGYGYYFLRRRALLPGERETADSRNQKERCVTYELHPICWTVWYTVQQMGCVYMPKGIPQIFFVEGGGLFEHANHRHRQPERRRWQNNNLCELGNRSGTGRKESTSDRRGPARKPDNQLGKSATRQAAIYTIGCNGQNSDGSAYTPRRRYSASCRRR